MPTTRDRLNALHRQEPHLNQTELADRLGVTRQRVQQLAESLHLTLDRGPRGPGGRKAAAEPSCAPEGITVPPGVTPAVATMLTAADLISRGYSVFIPINPSSSADLVAIDRNDRVEKIVVRRARRAGDEIRYDDPERKGARAALILTEEPVQYRPKLTKQE